MFGHKSKLVQFPTFLRILHVGRQPLASTEPHFNAPFEAIFTRFRTRGETPTGMPYWLHRRREANTPDERVSNDIKRHLLPDE